MTSVAFSSDGQWLASGSADNTVKLWHVSGERSLAYTYKHEYGVISLAFSSDGQWLASGSNEKTVRLWSVLTGNCQAVLQSFSGPVNAVVWQPMQDGVAILGTVGEDKAVRLWRVFYDSGQIGTIRLDWTSKQDVLTATGALIENARNLSTQNAALLIQRGAGLIEISENATILSEEGSDKSFCESDKFGETALDEGLTKFDGHNDFRIDFNAGRAYTERCTDPNCPHTSPQNKELLMQSGTGQAEVGESVTTSFEEESESKTVSPNASNLIRVNKLITENELLSALEPGEMSYDEEESVDDKATDAKFFLKRKTYSTRSTSLEMDRKR